jgi:TIR domain
MTKFSVFISHRSDDDEWAEAFARALELQNVDVWLDERVAPGAKWADLLRRKLATSDALIALVGGSNESSASQLWEIGAAVGMGKRIITIVPEGVEGSGLPLPLRKVRTLKRGAPAATAAVVAGAIAKEAEPQRTAP